MKQSLLRVISIALFLALAFSAALPLGASADEGTPPTEEPAPSEDGGDDYSTVSTDQAAPSEEGTLETVADESAAADGETNTEPVAEDPVVDEPVLADLPPDTELIVLDESGGEVSLASEEADAILASGDPIWCPAGVAPQDGIGGCSPFYTSLEDLETWLYTQNAGLGPNVNGVIWIEKTYSSSTGLYLDGATLTNMATKTLTIKGGWNGLGTATVDVANPSVLQYGSVQILDWLSDVTLSDIIFTSNFGPALSIETNGKVTLTRVDAEDNHRHGVYIDNTAGSKDVLITDGEYVNNGLDGIDNQSSGLVVFSNGIITLANVTANGNFQAGIWLDNNDNGGLVKGINLTGTTVVGENGTSGLVAFSNGAIKINNLIANSNGNHGAYLDNSSATLAQLVTLTKYNEFKFNGGSGLEVYSKGAITLANISATNNTEWGVFLDNCREDLGDCTAASNVLITGTNLFSENGGTGLDVYSGGMITLSNVTAYWNGFSIGGAGADLDNSDALSAKAVTLTGTNHFEGNDDNGLEIQSFGAISISNLTSNSNGGIGANIENSSAPSPQFAKITGKAEFQWNGDFGLRIASLGAITVNNLYSNDNGFFAVHLDNSGLGASGGVTVTGTAGFKAGKGGVFDNDISGMYIYSTGPVLLQDLDFIANGGYGLYVDNAGGSAGNVTVGTTLSGYCSGVGENSLSGMEIYTNGIVILNNICAWDNGGHGAWIDNSAAGSAKAVTLNGSNSFDGNALEGLHVLSRGPITTSNLSAWGNGASTPSLSYIDSGYGVYLHNLTSGSATPQNVTLKGYVDVGNNFYGGIEVHTYGAISAANVYSEFNGWGESLDADKYGYGALLLNNYGTLNRPVTLTGTNSFYDNWSGGLHIESFDAIKVNNLEASYNGYTGYGGIGASLDNCAEVSDACTTGFSGKAVLISGYGDFYNNEANGLWVNSSGAITAANLTANGNGSGGGAGAYLDNAWGGAVGGITLTGFNTFNDNDGGSGLSAYSYGAIKGSNLEAWGNSGDGLHIDNDWSGSTTGAIVTLTGFVDVGENAADGLYILSWRAVSVANIFSGWNGDHGAWIDNTSAGTVSPQNVILSGSNTFNGNDLDGLVVLSYGQITASNLYADGNGWNGGGVGVYLDNCLLDAFDDCTAATPKAVILTGSNQFYGNESDGLDIISMGAIKVNNLTANWNGWDGAYLDNQWGQPFTGQGVTLTGINHFEDNDGYGLDVYSHGNLTMSNITATWNIDGGAYLDNWSLSGAQVNVTLTGTNIFNSNGDWVAHTSLGLEIWSEGNISINNLTANWNDEGGAYLNNYDYSWLTPTVTLTGTNNFLANYNSGLVIDALGNVSLSKVTADWNGNDGVNIYSDVGSITIVCGSMTNNGSIGLNADAWTTLTLKGVFALGNGTNTSLSGSPILIARSC